MEDSVLTNAYIISGLQKVSWARVVRPSIKDIKSEDNLDNINLTQEFYDCLLHGYPACFEKNSTSVITFLDNFISTEINPVLWVFSFDSIDKLLAFLSTKPVQVTKNGDFDAENELSEDNCHKMEVQIFLEAVYNILSLGLIKSGYRPIGSYFIDKVKQRNKYSYVFDLKIKSTHNALVIHVKPCRFAVAPIVCDDSLQKQKAILCPFGCLGEYVENTFCDKRVLADETTLKPFMTYFFQEMEIQSLTERCNIYFKSENIVVDYPTCFTYRLVPLDINSRDNFVEKKQLFQLQIRSLTQLATGEYWNAAKNNDSHQSLNQLSSLTSCTCSNQSLLKILKEECSECMYIYELFCSESNKVNSTELDLLEFNNTEVQENSASMEIFQDSGIEEYHLDQVSITKDMELEEINALPQLWIGDDSKNEELSKHDTSENDSKSQDEFTTLEITDEDFNFFDMGDTEIIGQSDQRIVKDYILDKDNKQQESPMTNSSILITKQKVNTDVRSTSLSENKSTPPIQEFYIGPSLFSPLQSSDIVEERKYNAGGKFLQICSILSKGFISSLSYYRHDLFPRKLKGVKYNLIRKRSVRPRFTSMQLLHLIKSMLTKYSHEDFSFRRPWNSYNFENKKVYWNESTNPFLIVNEETFSPKSETLPGISVITTTGKESSRCLETLWKNCGFQICNNFSNVNCEKLSILEISKAHYFFDHFARISCCNTTEFIDLNNRSFSFSSNHFLSITKDTIIFLHPSSLKQESSMIINMDIASVRNYENIYDRSANINKYAKFNVKKKRLDPQLVATLKPPNLRVLQSISNDFRCIEGTPTILRFWDKLSLYPHSDPSIVNYFVIAPAFYCCFQTEDFFKELSSVYEMCSLGQHLPLNMQEDFCEGAFFTVSLQEKESGMKKSYAQIIAEYKVRAFEIGQLLAAKFSSHFMQSNDSTLLCYLIDPTTGQDSLKIEMASVYMEFLRGLSECQQKDNILKSDYMILPLDRVLHHNLNIFEMRELAFSVYSTTQNKGFISDSVEEFYREINPCFWISPTYHVFPEVSKSESGQLMDGCFIRGKERDHFIFVGYEFSACKRWLFCTWCDDIGSCFMYKFYYNNEQNSDSNVKLKIWLVTTEFAQKYFYKWRIVIYKLSTLSIREIKEWDEIVCNHGSDTRQANNSIVSVSILCIDFDSVFETLSNSFGNSKVVPSFQENGEKSNVSCDLYNPSESEEVHEDWEDYVITFSTRIPQHSFPKNSSTVHITPLATGYIVFTNGFSCESNEAKTEQGHFEASLLYHISYNSEPVKSSNQNIDATILSIILHQLSRLKYSNAVHSQACFTSPFPQLSSSQCICYLPFPIKFLTRLIYASRIFLDNCNKVSTT